MKHVNEHKRLNYLHSEIYSLYHMSSLVFGIDGIWYSTLIAEALSMVLGVIFLITKRKKFNY